MEDIQPQFQEDQGPAADPVEGQDFEQTQLQPQTDELKTEDFLSESHIDVPPDNSQETDPADAQPPQSQEVGQAPAEETGKAESPPPSQYEALETHLSQTRYDSSAWNKLIDLAEQSGDLSKIKQAYESLLQAYPNTAEAQIAYLEHYLSPGLFPTAEALFNRFLKPSPSVRLWKFYLTYVRRMNTDPSTRDMVSKAYDFALLYIGQDKDSGDIWREYIDFLKARETHTTWEEQQKMDVLRRIYQRAVQIPLENVEQLWSEYNAFEVGLNKITARKFIQDQSKGYMTAKEVLKQLRSHLAILFPPSAHSSTNGRTPLNLPEPMPVHSEGRRMLAKAWKAYLQWEQKNPLELEEKELNSRLHGTFKKAVVRMRFNPETWYTAYTWTEKHGKAEEAVSYIKSGLEANPASYLLNFAYAEAQEAAKNNTEVHATFTKFIDVLHDEIEKVEKTITPDNSFSSNGSNATLPSSSSSSVAPQKEFARRRTELGIAWIVYMRFARRAEGLKPARAVFGKARKDKWISWEVYEAAASMEYHFTKATDVATRIFETGLKLFSDDASYIVKYLKFLISINDENNARALFERVIGTFVPDKARPIWETWANYEYNFGDLSAAHKLEKRMSEVYPDDAPMRRFAQRHAYSNVDAIAIRDLGWMPAGAGSSSSSNGSLKHDSSLSTNNTGSSGSLGGPSTQKRQASPERGRSGFERSASQDMGPPPPKRAREFSPPPRDRERDRRERDRDRREPPPPRRRYDSPDWGRGSPPRRGGDVHPRGDWDRDGPDDRAPGGVPGPTTWFLGQLLPAPSFDGPVFRVDDLMQVFRNATIPGSLAPRPRSPPRGGRPPPDYGPYRGPGGGRGGRGY